MEKFLLSQTGGQKRKKGEAVFIIYEALEKHNCPVCCAVEIRNVL